MIKAKAYTLLRLVAASLAFVIFCSFTPLELVPVAYKGRFRPSEVYAKLWLHEFYHADQLDHEDLKAFHTLSPSALELVWKMELLGYRYYVRSPLFWVRNKELRSLLKIDQSVRTSFSNLEQRFYTEPEILNTLVTYYFLKAYTDSSNRSQAERIDITSLSHGLVAQFEQNNIKIVSTSDRFPWNILTPGTIVQSEARNNIPAILASKQSIAEEIQALIGLMYKFKSTDYLKLIPSRSQSGHWIPINAVDDSDYNISAYSDQIYKKIKESYLKMNDLVDDKPDNDHALFEQGNVLAQDLLRGYASIEGKAYQKSYERELKYPTLSQLKAENLYSSFPFAEIATLAYLTALTALLLLPIFPFNLLKWIAGTGLALGLILHTFILALRIYILERAPVSNMFETVVYVPWVAVIVSLGLAYYYRNTLPLIASAALACVLLTVIELTRLNSSLENVQAVLDSQFWLIIHVLMIVGSYGVLALAGIIGHYYVASYLYHQKATPPMNFAAKILLQTLYLGVALLIPGTILGGVWAAESWGRFWDWDPKESWAFISAGVYLIAIHAYRFGQISNFGLAIGSIIGLMSISFTWYGVNYILGTGLHTYGFGSGGEYIYYTYLIGEALFIVSALLIQQKYGLRKT